MATQFFRKGAAVLLVSLAMAGCAGAPQSSSDFKDIAEEIDAITVMPPAFTLAKVGAFSSEAVASMTHDIENEIKRATESLVDESRYDVAVFDASDEALASDPELLAKLFDQEQEIALVAAKIDSASGDALDIEYSADLDYFADRIGADYFLFIEGSGWFKTEGAQFKEAILAGVFGGTPTSEPTSGTQLTGFLVDANRGKILWYHSVDKENHDPRKPSAILQTCKDLFKPILGKSSLKADQSREHEIIDKHEGSVD